MPFQIWEITAESSGGWIRHTSLPKMTQVGPSAIPTLDSGLDCKICTYLLKPYDFCLIDFLEQFKFRFESSFIVSKTKQHPEE